MRHDLLWDRIPAPAHHNAPDGTSEVSAARIEADAPTLRAKVYAMIRLAGDRGVTDEEGEDWLDMRSQTYTPRRGELVKLGLVVDSGQRRKTRGNRPAAVWIATGVKP